MVNKLLDVSESVDKNDKYKERGGGPPQCNVRSWTHGFELVLT